MSTIVTRAGKGSPLTHTELDANQTNLNTDKVEAADVRTFTNKTINLANNTVIGTLAEFNTALSDGNFASLAGAETLTNKTIDLCQSINLSEVVAPSTPAANTVVLYAKSDGLLYSKDDAGTEQAVSGVAASESVSGKVELATTAEVKTGTDTGRVPSVSSLTYTVADIPSWVKKIKIYLVDIVTNGTAPLMLQFGATVFDVSNYKTRSTHVQSASATFQDSTAGFFLTPVVDSSKPNFCEITLSCLNDVGTTWTCFSTGTTFSAVPETSYYCHGYTQSLSTRPTKFRLLAEAGTDLLVSGSIIYSYE
jgi:hypothetical protein